MKPPKPDLHRTRSWMRSEARLLVLSRRVPSPGPHVAAHPHLHCDVCGHCLEHGDFVAWRDWSMVVCSVCDEAAMRVVESVNHAFDVLGRVVQRARKAPLN